MHKIELEMQHDELRRAQQALDVSLERYSDLFDLAPISYLTLSEHGRIIDVNQAAARLLGVAQTALAGAPFHGFVLGEDQDLFYLHCRQLFRTGVSQAFEVRLSLPDGRLLVAWTEMSAAQGGAGQPVCRAVLSDVSDRRGQEMQMRLQNQALNSTSSGILFADTLGKIERVNLAFTELTGYRAADVEGKNLSQVFSLPVTVSELREAALLADWEGEVSTCATDNSRRHRLKISPVKDRFGQNTHLIAVLEPPLRGGARPVAVEKPLPKPMVAPAAETKSVKRGRVLFREGDRPGQLYRVKSGWVKLSRASLKGRDLIVDVLFPGDYFDIQSLLDGQPSSYTASTLRYFPAEIDYLPCQTALDDPHVKSALQQQLVSRMRHQQEMMSALATFRVEERVRLALRILARRAGSREGAERIVPMPLTRHELGEMIGATAEATIRALSDMQRRGLVRWVGRDLVCSAVVLEDRALCIN
ncbi:PAS domain S-box protein [bacterium]|nr:PAS domain S-box protein [bacterium]